MKNLGMHYIYCQAQVQSPSPNPIQGFWGDTIIPWAKPHPTPPGPGGQRDQVLTNF